MAQRRMIAMTIFNSDAFLDLPLTAQALYTQLLIRADDDGFIGNPKRIQQYIGASAKDLQELYTKRFLLKFDSGVAVIKHWRMQNNIRADRKEKTAYQDELQQLEVKSNGAYTEATTADNVTAQVEQSMADELSAIMADKVADTTADKATDTGKVSIGKVSIGKNNKRFTPPTLQEVADYCKERGNDIDAQYFLDHYTSNGWKVGGKAPMKDWKAAVRNWEKNGYSTGRKQKAFTASEMVVGEQDIEAMKAQMFRGH